ncbi:MAG: EutN/CcmL family microcompartment protein [Candidatus Sericytochromatia bacterium]|nr:EutN/CcmL family microcompartment protein [Candidatus Sericytochromatia bacterium]
MQIGVVSGTVVSSHKDPRLSGCKLLVVRQVDLEGRPSGPYVVAVDAVGAGPGEYVLFATGSSARQTDATENRPVDCTIMAIVDMWEVDGVVHYQKDAPVSVAEE